MVSREGAVRYQPVGRAFVSDFHRRLAEGEGFALGKDIGQQHVVLLSEWVQWLGEGDEVAGDQARSQMNQLVEGMLAVGAGLAPIDRPGVAPDRRAREGDALAVALHRQLLQMGGKALQVLLVGEDPDRLRAEEVVVPDRE